MYKFDYEILKRQIINKCFCELKKPAWSAEEYYTVIKYFLVSYERFTGRQHYRLSNNNLLRIMELLPYADNENGITEEYAPQDYFLMIDKYFMTNFKSGCDRSIYHFLSDNVRLNRFYEVCY